MSLIKNLRRKEVEIFGARKIVRNSNEKTKVEKEVQRAKKNVKAVKKV